MKIAVVGAGAIGGYLGARLALAGEDVTFIARGANLAALRASGIRLIEEDGKEHAVSSVRAVQSMAEAGPQDYVLLTLKAHQVGAVAADLPALFGAETALVTMQRWMTSSRLLESDNLVILIAESQTDVHQRVRENSRLAGIRIPYPDENERRDYLTEFLKSYPFRIEMNDQQLASMTSGLNFGFRRTLPHVLGVNIGFSFLVIVVGLGLGAIFAAYPVLYKSEKGRVAHECILDTRVLN